MIMMEKRGVSHIEFILSFLLFLSATMLALYFFSPAYKTEVVSSSLSYAYDAIIKEANTRLDVYYSEPQGLTAKKIKIDGLDGKNVRVECENTAISQLVGTAGGGITWKKYQEPSKIGAGEEGVCYKLPISNCKLVGIYASEDIEDMDGNLPCSGASELPLSSVSEILLSEKKLTSLSEENYDELKGELKIPSSNDFSFSLVLSDETISVEKEVPEGINVYSKSNRIKVLREDGTREYAEFQVKIW